MVVGESVRVGEGGYTRLILDLQGGNSNREMKQRRTVVVMMTTVRMWRMWRLGKGGGRGGGNGRAAT